MKRLFSILFSIFLYTGISLADDRIALIYNIVPDDDSKKNSIVDSRIQKKLSFKLYSANQGSIYFNGSEIVATDGRFDIDISNLTGKQELKFTNDLKEEAIFTYYISDENGLVKDYTLSQKQAYIKTVDSTKILYTSKDAAKINFVSNLIVNMPDKMKNNLKEITMLPIDHSSKAAGITNYNKITFYNISTYSNQQIENIVYHEIAHTWAYDLMKQKSLDYSYTDFSVAIEHDNNYVSKYSKGNASEDFAESIAFYLINSASFTNKYPARTAYISTLL